MVLHALWLVWLLLVASVVVAARPPESRYVGYSRGNGGAALVGSIKVLADDEDEFLVQGFVVYFGRGDTDDHRDNNFVQVSVSGQYLRNQGDGGIELQLYSESSTLQLTGKESSGDGHLELTSSDDDALWEWYPAPIACHSSNLAGTYTGGGNQLLLGQDGTVASTATAYSVDPATCKLTTEDGSLTGYIFHNGLAVLSSSSSFSDGVYHRSSAAAAQVK